MDKRLAELRAEFTPEVEKQQAPARERVAELEALPRPGPRTGARDGTGAGARARGVGVRAVTVGLLPPHWPAERHLYSTKGNAGSRALAALAAP